MSLSFPHGARAGLCLYSCLAATAGASAQALSSQAPATMVEEITVTATRAPVTLSKAPAAIEVIAARDLQSREAFRLGDALRDSAGVFFRGSPFGGATPGSGQGAFSMRGIAGNRSLVLIDGQVMNSGSSNAVNWSSIALTDVERIEVVPGAFSALWGGNALGGVINIITRAPDERAFSLDAGYTTDAVEERSIQGSYRDRFANGLGIVLSASYRQNDSFIGDFVLKAPTNGAGTVPTTGAVAQTVPGSQTNPAPVVNYLVGDKGARPWTQQNYAARLTYDLSQATRLDLGATYDTYRTTYTAAHSYLTDAKGNAVFTGASVGLNAANTIKTALSITDFLTLTPSEEPTARVFGHLKSQVTERLALSADLSYADLGNYYVTYISGKTTAYEGGPGAKYDTPNTKLEGTAQASLDLSEDHQIVAGASVVRNTMDQTRVELSDWRDPDTTTSVFYAASGEAMTWSLFAQERWRALPDLTLYLGGRFDQFSTSGRVRQGPTSLQPGLVALDARYGERVDTNVSPKVSAVFTPAERVTLRASIGTAFRPPTLLDLYSTGYTTKTNPTGTLLTMADPHLKPERLFAQEVGAEIKPRADTILTVTLYNNELSDLLYTYPIISGTTADLSQKINVGKARVRGIESSVRARPWEGVSVFASAGLRDARVSENARQPETVGKRLADTPQNQWALGADWAHGPWSAFADVTHTGKTFGSSDSLNTGTLNGVFGTYQAVTLVNLKIARRLTDAVTLSASANNLLDKRWFSYYLQHGRTVTMSVSARF